MAFRRGIARTPQRPGPHRDFGHVAEVITYYDEVGNSTDRSDSPQVLPVEFHDLSKEPDLILLPVLQFDF